MAVMQGINVALTSVIGLGFGLLFFPGLPLWLVFPFALVLILVWSGAVRLLLCLSRTASAGPRTWPDEDLAR